MGGDVSQRAIPPRTKEGQRPKAKGQRPKAKGQRPKVRHRSRRCQLIFKNPRRPVRSRPLLSLSFHPCHSRHPPLSFPTAIPVIPDIFNRESTVLSLPIIRSARSFPPAPPLDSRSPWIPVEDGFPLKTGGNDKRGTGGNDRRGLPGMTEGVLRESRDLVHERGPKASPPSPRPSPARGEGEKPGAMRWRSYGRAHEKKANDHRVRAYFNAWRSWKQALEDAVSAFPCLNNRISFQSYVLA